MNKIERAERRKQQIELTLRRKQEKENRQKRYGIHPAIKHTFDSDFEKTFPKKPEKRPQGNVVASRFIWLFSDVSIEKAASWKPTSYNVDKQNEEFFRRFIYPYFVPETIFMSAMFLKDVKAISYLKDIVSGESFYKRHPEFTKAECHFILSSKAPYIDPRSLRRVVYEAKIQARKLDKNVAAPIVTAFTNKFDNWDHPLVKQFFDFIVRNADYGWDRETLEDLSDFIESRIREMLYFGRDFTLAGRTVNSLIELCNRWHAEQLKKDAADGTWEGLRYKDASYEDNDFVWEITQIKNGKALSAEGRKMHHCVGGYVAKCKAGTCGIYHVGAMNKRTFIVADKSTFEVSMDGYLIQHRGKCNENPDKNTVRIVNRWCLDNYVRH
jgi:hypothetical protein